MPATSDASERRRAQAIRVGAGIFGGFALLAAADALAIALTIPLPRAGIALRLQHHLFDAAETLGVGAVVALIAGGAASLGRRWAAMAACLAMWVPTGYLAIGDDLRRNAEFAATPRLEIVLFGVYVALLCAALPVIQLVGGRLSAMPRLRLAALGAAALVLAVDHLFLTDDYAGLHAMIALSDVVLAAALIGPLAERAALRLAGARRGRAVIAATAALAIFGVACPPPDAVRCELFRNICAVAPWALASIAWRSPPLHAPVAVPASPWLLDRSAAPPVPPTSPRLLPSDAVVVLITIDATRAEAVLDPARDKLLPTLADLKRRGAVFTRASAPGSQTALSLGTVFSGRYFSELYWSRFGTGRSRFDFPAEDPSVRFPAILSENGVETVHFPSLVFLANDFGVVRGFREERVLVHGVQRAHARDVIEPILGHLRRGGGPLFAFAHLVEPHDPYDRGKQKSGPEYERYLSAVAVADAQIGRVVRALEEHAGDRWALFVTADHGEAFGEHGTATHGKTLYEELLHVPLIVAGPRIAPRTIDERVGLVDLGPTILDLFGLPAPAAFEGQSLAPLLAGRGAALTRPLIAEGRLRRAITLPDGLKVIDDPRRKIVEVYDLSSDPGETRNLFDLDPARADPPLAFLRAFFAAHTLKRDGYEPPYKL
jgi:hypothetical protein